MKIQCDACEKAVAALLCCADEAALCWACDEKVHEANKLAAKHQRVPLFFAPTSATANRSSASAATANHQMPACDICQDKAGYFFCLEDRALLCRNCDVGIHTSTPYGSSHQRFLITGIRVALQHYFVDNSNNTTTMSNNDNRSNSNGSNSGNSSVNQIIPHPLLNSSITNKKLVMDEGEGLRGQWMWNEVFDCADVSQCYGISDPGSSS